MCVHDITLTRHDSEPWTLQVAAPEFGGVNLCLLDEEGRACARAAIQPIGEFYQVLLPNLQGSRRNPYVGWAEGHERLGELLPQYEAVLAAKVRDLLYHPIVRALRLREFYAFLRQATVTNQGQPDETAPHGLQLVFDLRRIHIQPRMVQAVFRIFPDQDTTRDEG